MQNNEQWILESRQQSECIVLLCGCRNRTSLHRVQSIATCQTIILNETENGEDTVTLRSFDSDLLYDHNSFFYFYDFKP